jgi:hypothetical protein
MNKVLDICNLLAPYFDEKQYQTQQPEVLLEIVFHKQLFIEGLLDYEVALDHNKLRFFL